MKLPILNCQVCKHKWVPRITTPPVKCPKCQSPHWNKKK